MANLPSVLDGGLQKFKTAIYTLQALLVGIAWILTIAVLTKPGTIEGPTKFYFFLTWICLPAFLYLAVVPLWPRTIRFVNPYATATLDVVFTIFWLSAICAVQVWTDSGIKDSSKGCSSFDGGDYSKCTISQATVIIGVIIFTLWTAASAISVYSLIHFRKTGYLPYTRPTISKPIFDETQLKAGLTTDAHEDEESLFRPATCLNRLDEENTSVYTDHTATEEGTHPGRPLSWGQDPPLTAPPAYNQRGVLQSQFNPTHYASPPNEANNPQQSSVSPPTINRLNSFGNHPTLSLLQLYSAGNPYTSEGSGSLSPHAGAPYDSVREVMRGPRPGPASQHVGGYNSAYHTPLPTGLSHDNISNSWRSERPNLSHVTRDDGRFVYPPGDHDRLI